jgi:hypothetical protein
MKTIKIVTLNAKITIMTMTSTNAKNHHVQDLHWFQAARQMHSQMTFYAVSEFAGAKTKNQTRAYQARR